MSRVVVMAAGAAALATILTACSSSGGSVSASLTDPTVPTQTASSPASQGAAVQVSPPAIRSAAGLNGGVPAPYGRSNAAFPQSGSAPAQPGSNPGSALPTPTGAITFVSTTFPRPYNCAEAGTTYYTPPNVTASMDVTVLVTSSTLARDLVIAAPNRAPRGLSNASQLVSSTSVGKNVWQATYRTYVALYEPKYTPVTVSQLEASADGTRYTIAFRAPVTVTLADCHN